MEYESIGKTTYALLNGVGHMWFLPMLFWCFIAAYYLHKLAVTDKSKLVALACLSVISFLPLPLRLGNTLYYLFFFYLGIVLYKKKDQISNKVTPKIIGVLWIVFLALFVVGSLTNRSLLELHYDMLLLRLLTYSGINIIKLSYSTIGTLAIFCTALYFTRRYRLPKQVKEAGKLCFGAYLFQQFVLQLIYYRTALFNHPYMAPWVGFVVALALSVFLAWGLRKTKIGRSLI